MFILKKEEVQKEGTKLYEVGYEGIFEVFQDFKNEIRKNGFFTAFLKVIIKISSGTLYVIADNPEGGWQMIHYFNEKQGELKGFKFLEKILYDSPGSKGVRNRTKKAKELISNYIDDRKSVRIVDLGCGIGTYGLHAIKESFEEGNKEKIRYIGVDIDTKAIELSRNIFGNVDPSADIEFKNVEANRFLEKNEKPFDLVISMGIIDYLKKENSERFLKNIKENMKMGNKEKGQGMLIISVTDNYPFDNLAEIAGMKGLNHRTKDDLKYLLSKTGYGEVEIFSDESRSQHIAIARKI